MNNCTILKRTGLFIMIIIFVIITLPFMTKDVHAAYSNNLKGSVGVHDPVMIKEGNTYYVFSTGDYIPMKKSNDGVNWKDIGNVFSSPPSWFKNYVPGNDGKNIWAPDISYYKGVYYLYYSVSTFGSNTSAIGLATNTTLDPLNPNYKWVDKGMVIRSTGGNNYNCIDPNRIDDQDGRSWLTFGSFWGGLMITEIDPSTGMCKSGAPVTTIAKRSSGTAIEAPFMIYVNGYYYLFASWDKCCSGVDSTYKIVFGRSKTVTGPFYDMSGKSMAQGGGTILWSGDERWKGPGHNGICFDDNKVLIVYHSYDSQANGAPIMHIRQLYFGSGWPSFESSGNEPIINPTPTMTYPPTPTPTSTPTSTPTTKPSPLVSPDSFIYGDLNGDKLIDSTDFSLMKRYLLKIVTSFTYDKGMEAADLNGDSSVDSIDYALLKRFILGIITQFNVSHPVTSTPSPSQVTPYYTFLPEKTPDLNAYNTVIRLESYNNKGLFLRHFDYIARMEEDPAPFYDSYFVEKAGLADPSCVSFESVNYPGYYLRHVNYELKIVKDDGSNLFKQDATFKKVRGLADSLYISYQSYNFPDMYIRNDNSLLRLTTIETQNEKAEATFNVIAESNTFNNPRNTKVEMPDPWVLKHTDGYYYGMHTVMRNGYVPELILYKSNSLIDLFTKGTSKVIWKAPTSGWNNKDIWAPELYWIDNAWYIYYSANFRFGVLSNKNADPMTGSWTDHGRLSPDVWAIDATLLRQNGNMYMLWSGQNSGQCINITRMASPISLTGQTVTLSQPTYNWERRGLNVNEAPEILQRNGKTFCVYSASYCATQYYSLGMLTCSSNADPMVKSNWTKSPVPVFQASPEDGLYGTGHNSFTTSKDGTQDWIVYHATIVPSEEYQTRYTCMQQFVWNSDGTPNFWGPCGRKIAIPKPSGE